MRAIYSEKAEKALEEMDTPLQELLYGTLKSFKLSRQEGT
ncbi:Uncharacterised protein [uncultured archaeon]|nr:Uncharacterised protein [uncultured archaeon]